MKFEKDFAIAYGQSRSGIWRFIEAILITILFLFLARIFWPEDPFTLHGPIPWLILAPIFCALFYGAIYGLSSLLLVLAVFLLQPGMEINQFIQREYILGLIILTCLVAVFSSYWQARIRHVEDLNYYVRDHLENLSRSYYLLQISHERIEQAYLVKPLSLRDAFVKIREAIFKNNSEINANHGQMLLEVFSLYSGINSAAFCLYDSHEIRPLAFLGEQFLIPNNDPLIKEVIEKKVSTYFAVNQLDENETSHFAAAIPMLDNENTLIGLIILKDVPFWALTHDNMEVLSVFAAYFALQWTTVQKVADLMKVFPSCPPEFLKELQTLISLSKNQVVPSALAAVVIPAGSQQDNIVFTLTEQKRSLDFMWILDGDKSKTVITLLPLTSTEGIAGHKKRIAALLRGDFGEEINKNGYYFRSKLLNNLDAAQQLQDFIKEVPHAAD
jgi:hypothetical protein